MNHCCIPLYNGESAFQCAAGFGLLVFYFFILLWKFFFFFFFTLQYCSGFCHTLTWISHRFTCVPHPDPPSLPIPSLWVFPVHQPWALVSCIQPGLVICFTLDSILVSMLFSQNIQPSPSPTESKSLFCTSVSLFLFWFGLLVFYQEILHLHSLRIVLCIFLFSSIIFWFRYQDNVNIVKLVWDCSLMFEFLKEFRNNVLIL